MKEREIIALLRRELTVAMGCTEPAASALAGANARDALGRQPDSVSIRTSRDMIKNAMGVGIPGCDLRGIQAAVALGICGGRSSEGLSILSDIGEERLRQAGKLLGDGRISLEMVEAVPPVFIEVRVSADGHRASATISGEHDRVSSLTRDGEELSARPAATAARAAESDDMIADPGSLSVSEILDFALSTGQGELDFVYEAAAVNMDMARHARSSPYGLSVGRTVLESLSGSPRSLAEALTLGAGLAAAASDARMSGCPRPVVINSGSGNQGITCSVPVVVLGEYLACDRSRIARALCVSHLVALSLTARKGRLSALCGAFTAAIGAGCGMEFLLGGGVEGMAMVVNSMVANLSGIVCDGAKGTCALKIYSCVEAAGLSCRLAAKGIAPGRDLGILGGSAAETMDFLSRISNEGMIETDKAILRIMVQK